MIQKYWFGKARGDDKILLVGEDMIYKGNPKPADLQKSLLAVSNNRIPEGLFTIPFSYLKEIRMQKGKDYIEVRFAGDSTEHLKIQDDNRRYEVFDYFQENIPGAYYEIKKYSKFKAARKQLIAMFVSLILYIWAVDTIYRIENYEGFEVLIIVLALAGLGLRNLTLLFAVIFTIGGVSIFYKMKNPPEFEVLEFD